MKVKVQCVQLFATLKISSKIFVTKRSKIFQYSNSFFADSTNVLSELENIDDEADVFKIRFVRIHDLELAEDYSLYYLT